MDPIRTFTTSAALAASLAAAKVEFSCVPNGRGFTVTYKVTPGPGERFRDFHLYRRSDRISGNPRRATDGAARKLDGWDQVKVGKWIHWWGPARSAVTLFTIDVPAGGGRTCEDFKDVAWYVTLSGKPQQGFTHPFHLFRGDHVLDAGGSSKGSTKGPLVSAICKEDGNCVTLVYDVKHSVAFRDFHLVALSGRKIVGEPLDTPNFEKKKSGSRVSWWLKKGQPSTRAATFRIKIKKDAKGKPTCKDLGRAKWFLTRNGRQGFRFDRDVLGLGTKTTGGRQAGKDVPLLAMSNRLNVHPLAPARIGGRSRIAVVGPPAPLYVLAASFGTQPGLQLRPGLHLELNPDALFDFSLSGPLIENGNGRMPPNGDAIAALQLPPDNNLVGLEFYMAAVLIDFNRPEFFMEASDPALIHVNAQ